MSDSIENALIAATTAQQSVAANPAFSVWASANAGAGKTKVLIDRIVRLLLDGAEPGQVLAVTYTKAAAAEMQTRLYRVLGAWTIADDKALSQALRELDPELDLEEPGRLSTARALFARALETPGGLKIQTIHAFCQAVLQRFPIEAGVAPGFKVLDDAQSLQIADIAYEQAAAEKPSVFLKIASLTHQEGHQEIVRKAASNRAHLQHVLSAQGDIEDRLSARLDVNLHETADEIKRAALESIDPETIRSIISLLQAHGTDAQIKMCDPLQAIIGTDAAEVRWEYLKLLFWKDKSERRSVKPTKAMMNMALLETWLWSTEENAGGLCRILEAGEDRLRRLKLLDKSRALTEATVTFARIWQDVKQSLGALDFDDLLQRTSALLRQSNSAAQWVLFKLDAGIEHVLIDESQDTNPDQWDLLQPIFESLESEERLKPRTRFVVGDEKQSIFSFQGARPERFLAEKQRFETGAPHLSASRRSLTFDLSFRTGQKILDAVDAVWATQAANPLPASDTEQKFAFPRKHRSSRFNQDGVVELWPLVLPGEAPTEREPWDHPLNMERQSSARNLLADQIALDLRRRLDAKQCIWDKGSTRPFVESDVMILVRRRNAFFHQLIKRLKHHRVAVAGADRIKLVEDPAIQDLIALARFALLPLDDFNLACVLKGVFCGLLDDNDHLFPLAHNRNRMSLWDRLAASQRSEHQAVYHYLEKVLARAGHVPPYEFFARLLEDATPVAMSGWRSVILRLGREAREPVEAFLAKAIEYGQGHTPTLQGFLELIEGNSAEVKRDAEQESPGVRIMTVHSAKGLEAPIVILPDTTSVPKAESAGVFYDYQSRCWLWSDSAHDECDSVSDLREAAEAANQQESQRLLYVAMTRARDLLILCGHKTGNPKNNYAPKTWYAAFQDALPLLGEPEVREYIGFKAQVWGTDPPLGEASPQLSTDIGLAPLPDWFDAPPPTQSPLPRRIAPSALSPDGAEPAGLSPLAPNAKLRFLRGRLIHELLQRLPEIDPLHWRDVAHRRLQRENDLSLADRDMIVDETLGVLHHPDFAPLFGKNSRAEAAIVGRGLGLPQDMVVNGSVDRLVVTESEVLILDFKTNRPPPLDISGVAKVYLNQMAAYRALCQANWPDKGVRCALLWTDGPRLMEIPQSVLDEALRDIAGLPT